jgi:CHAT domain-containing protein/tetratricopeptide (TPR) repeat protein
VLACILATLWLAAPSVSHADPEPATSQPVDSLGIANRLFREGQLATAETLLRRLLTQAERDSGASSPRVGSILDLLVPALWRGGKSQTEETLQLAQRAVAVKEVLYGPADPQVATSLFSVGVIRAMGGDYAGAESIFAHALEIREAGLPPGHEDIASSINALANIRYLGADFAGALPLYRRSLTMVEEDKGLLDGQALSIRGNVANALIQLGSYEEARSLLERQIALLESEGIESEDLGYAHSLLGKIFAAIGDLDEALRARRQSLAIREAFHPEDHPRIAESLLNLGNTLSRMEQLAEARELISRSRAIWERNYGSEHPNISSFHEALGRVAFKEGNFSESRGLHELALKGCRASSAEDSPEVAEVLQSLARIAQEEGRYDEARGHLELALDIATRKIGARHPRVAEYEHNLAMVEFLGGHDAAATAHALSAEHIFTEHLQLTLRGLPERQALRYAQQSRASLDLALALLDEIQDPQMIARTWDALIRSRAIVLDEMAARARRSALPADSSLASFIAEYQRTNTRLANLVVRGPQDTDAEIYRRLLDEARREMESAERRLAKTHPLGEAADTPIGLSEVAHDLPPGSALVAYVRYECPQIEPPRGCATTPRYRAFVISPATAGPVSITIGDGAGIDDLIADWRVAISQGPRREGRGEEEALRAYTPIGHVTRRILWEPVASHLGDATRVFVVPDGQLHLLNLAALPDSAGGYLAESTVAFHQLSAERGIVESVLHTAEGAGVLVIGAPDFDQADIGDRSSQTVLQKAVVGAASLVTTFRGQRPDCEALRSVRFPPLPGSLREAQEVADLWRQQLEASGPTPGSPVPRVALLAGREASENAFKRMASGNRSLHLATHTYFLDRRCSLAAARNAAEQDRPETAMHAPDTDVQVAEMLNPLLLSGLALAGANRRDSAQPDEDDGILTAQEIAALDLSGVHWVILSACETGTGEVLSGEGVFGLERAFRIAGARTLITSLWAVEDDAARRWMHAFYQQGLHRGRDVIGSVREANLSVLRERRERGESTHPFYWAPFIATGDWR